MLLAQSTLRTRGRVSTLSTLPLLPLRGRRSRVAAQQNQELAELLHVVQPSVPKLLRSLSLQPTEPMMSMLLKPQLDRRCKVVLPAHQNQVLAQLLHEEHLLPPQAG